MNTKTKNQQPRRGRKCRLSSAAVFDHLVGGYAWEVEHIADRILDDRAATEDSIIEFLDSGGTFRRCEELVIEENEQEEDEAALRHEADERVFAMQDPPEPGIEFISIPGAQGCEGFGRGASGGFEPLAVDPNKGEQERRSKEIFRGAPARRNSRRLKALAYAAS